MHASPEGTVTVTEVSLRDGLQELPAWVPTDDKAALVACYLAAGLTDIEVTSFMRPDRVPQLADADQLARLVQPGHQERLSALIPNTRGLDRALAAGFRRVTVVLSASDAHNRANLGSDLCTWLGRVEQLVAEAKRRRVWVRGAISVAFGCPFEGRVPPSRVVSLARRLRQAGADVVSLADTMGAAGPSEVMHLAESVRETLGQPPSLHLHGRGGHALANAEAGLMAGVRHFDAALTGVGGCPFAPGAPGNLATEQLVRMLGEHTSLDVERVAVAAERLRGVLARARPLRAALPGNPGTAPLAPDVVKP